MSAIGAVSGCASTILASSDCGFLLILTIQIIADRKDTIACGQCVLDKVILEHNIKPCSMLDVLPLIDRRSTENPDNPGIQNVSVWLSRLIHPKHGKPRNYLEILESESRILKKRRSEKPETPEILYSASRNNKGAAQAITESLRALEQSISFLDDEDWIFQLALTRGSLQVQHIFAIANLRSGMSLGSVDFLLKETSPIFFEMQRSKTEMLSVIKHFWRKYNGDSSSIYSTFQEALSVWSRHNIH